MVLEASRRQPHLERFVHCSTTGVLGATGDQPVDETAPLLPTNFYESTKAEAECLVRDAMAAGFPAAIIRPGLVYGPTDLHLLGFFRAVVRGQFRPIGRRSVWLHPIYIDDMTEALAVCGHHPAAVGECFHIAGRQPVMLADLAATIARCAGTPVPSGHIPLAAARAVAAVGDLLPARVKRSAPLSRSRLEFLTHSRVYDVSKAQRLLGFEAQVSLEAGIERSLAWYRQHGHLPAVRAAA